MLSTADRGLIQDITGNIPLLIRPLLTIQNFDETTFLQSEQLHLVQNNIISFYNNLVEEMSTKTTASRER